MAPPEHIYELVERFDRNLDAYRSGKYNETQVRQEFINPFFENLGWDIYNKEGYSETKEPQAKTVLQRQIETTDRQIDRLVYELYGLTEEEIKIVEAESINTGSLR